MSLSPLILRRAPWPAACSRVAFRSVAAGSCGLDLAGDGVEFLASAGRLLRLPAPVKGGRADVQRMGEVGEGAEGMRAGTGRLGSFAPAALIGDVLFPRELRCPPDHWGRAALVWERSTSWTENAVPDLLGWPPHAGTEASSGWPGPVRSWTSSHRW